MIEDTNTKERPNRVAVDLTEDRDLEVSSTEGTAPENLRMTAPAPRSEQVEVGLNVPSPPPNAPIAIPIKSEAVATLFSPAEAGSLRSRWENIQIEFVDEPRDSVGHADQLVVEAIQSLATGFSAERQSSSNSGIDKRAFRPRTCGNLFGVTAHSLSESCPYD